MSAREFKFSYMVVSTTATLSDQEVSFKAGLRKGRAPIAALKHLFIQDMTGGDFEEMTLTFDSNGKQKKLKIYADKGSPEFHKFADELAALRPEIDIRSMPPEEAFKTMGVMDSNKWGAFVGVSLILLITLAALYPWAHHGFDAGHQEITLNNLAQGAPLETSNLTITEFDECEDQTVISETTHKGNTTVKYLIPLVPAGESCTAGEIQVILETHELSDEEAARLLSAETIGGILLDVWWEGLGGDERDYFNNEMGVTIAEDALLVEYQGDPDFYRMIFLAVMGVVALIMMGVAIVLRVQEKKRRGA